MWVAWWASKKPAHKQAAYVCVYVLYLAIGEVRIWRLHCRQHSILVSSTIAHMSLQHCLCDLLSVIFVHFSVVHFFVQIVHLWIFLIPINMRTSCIHSLPQEIQIPQPDQDQTKKMDRFQHKRSKQLDKQTKTKKKTLKRKKSFALGRIGCVFFMGRKFCGICGLWSCVRGKRKENGGGVGRADWLTSVAHVSFPALRTALRAIFSLIFVTGTTDRKWAFATSHKKLTFRSNPNIIPTNLTDATIHLAHGFWLQIHTFPTHPTKALMRRRRRRRSEPPV